MSQTIQFVDNQLVTKSGESFSCDEYYGSKALGDAAYCVYQKSSQVNLLCATAGSTEVIHIGRAAEWATVAYHSDNGALFVYAFARNAAFPVWTLSINAKGEIYSSSFPGCKKSALSH